MTLAGCQTMMIDLNFHLQKYLEIVDKNLADKIQFKNYSPYLMPIRVKKPVARISFLSKLRYFLICIESTTMKY